VSGLPATRARTAVSVPASPCNSYREAGAIYWTYGKWIWWTDTALAPLSCGDILALSSSEEFTLSPVMLTHRHAITQSVVTSTTLPP